MRETQKSENDKNLFRKIKPGNAIYPILIGFAVIGYMVWKEVDFSLFTHLTLNWHTVFWIFVALLCMCCRDLGYMIRIKILSDGQLSWFKAFRVIMLWEFTSAITPSAIGGTSVAVIYVHKEGINLGKSSAIVLLTSFLDELYFIIMFPLMLLLVGKLELFDIENLGEGFIGGALITFALTGYFLKLAYLLILSYGLFVNPRGLKWLLLKIFKLPFLKKWRPQADKTGTDIVTSSLAIRKKKIGFWGKVFGATFLSWSARYLVANALLLALFSVSDHALLFARQLVMWIMMLVMPTPGGSGFAEYIFTSFLGDLIPIGGGLQKGAAALVALLWRLITYYPYLAIGAIMFPRWIKRNFSKK